MKSDYMCRGFVSYIPCYCRTKVTALDTVAGIPQSIHQDDERFRHAFRAPTPGCSRSREAETRKGGDDHVECRHTPVCWPCEWGDQFHKLEYRTRPSVNQQQGYGVGTWRALMDKVNLLPVDDCGVLVETIDSRFLRAPVVLRLPVVRQVADFLDVCPVFPSCARQLIGPAGRRQSSLEIDKNVVRNVHFERSDGGRILLDIRSCLRRSRNNQRQKSTSRQRSPGCEHVRYADQGSGHDKILLFVGLLLHSTGASEPS